MKIKTQGVPVEVGNVQVQGEFHIKNSATAFAILSSGLYSNKYKAILRELGCNAFDSHIEAGKPDLPFTVHLPTRLNPILSVKDYGIGLDHESVMGLYTTYFASTKQDSNDYVGCMGLGSKSPFSYTKNFTITAIKDGWKGVYSAFIGDTGLPSIVQLTSEDTDEGNGIEVSFAVENNNDMRQFQHEAKKVFRWFTIKPELTGNVCDIPEIEYAEINIIPGTNIRKTKTYSYNDKSFAVMGNVAYPISIPDGEEIPKEIRDLYDSNCLVVAFEIGDFDIAASREELSYIPHTIKSLVDKGEKILAALGKHVAKRLDPCKTKWERTKLAEELLESNNNLFGTPVDRYLKKHPRKFVRFVRKNYSSIKMILPRSELEKITGLRYSFRQHRIRGWRVTQVLGTVKTETQRKNNATHKAGVYDPKSFYEAYIISPSKQTIIFADERGSVPNRIRLAMEDDNFKDLFKTDIAIFSPKTKDVDKKRIFKRLRTLFGDPNVILVSSLPLPQKTIRGSNGNKKITIQKFCDKKNQSRYGRSEYSFEPIYSKMKDITPTASKGKKEIFLYLPLTHKSIMKPFEDKNDPTWTATEFKDCISNGDIAAMAGIDIDNVYGVGKTSLKAVKAEKNWVNFFDYIEKKFNKIDWKKAGTETELQLISSQFSDHEMKLTEITPAMIARFAKMKTPFGIIAKEWRDMTKLKTSQNRKTKIAYDRVIRVMKILCPEMNFSAVGTKLDPEKIERKFEKLFNKVKKTYPMLQHLDLEHNRYNRENHWDQAIQYIKLVDSTL